jgi:hypothetical protein
MFLYPHLKKFIYKNKTMGKEKDRRGREYEVHKFTIDIAAIALCNGG